MTKLNFEGMAIADGIVETIIALAVRDVEGVASIGSSATKGILGLRRQNVSGVEVSLNEDDTLAIAVRVSVRYGYVMPVLAQNIRNAVAEAVLTQIGIEVSNVDVTIDGIQF